MAKHKGISCLLVDLRTPGIEVRPLRTITGDQPFAELFFTDVRVPASALLGPAHEGWTVAMTTLSFERAGVARLHLGLSKKLDHLLAEAEAARALADPRIRRPGGRRLRRHRLHAVDDQPVAGADAHGQPSGASGSLAKLAWGRTEQRLAELAVDVLGLAVLEGSWAYNLVAARQATIAGGTTEINRNIIGEMGLGLPREPEARLSPSIPERAGPRRARGRLLPRITARSGQLSTAGWAARTSPARPRRRPGPRRTRCRRSRRPSGPTSSSARARCTGRCR